MFGKGSHWYYWLSEGKKIFRCWKKAMIKCPWVGVASCLFPHPGQEAQNEGQWGSKQALAWLGLALPPRLQEEARSPLFLPTNSPFWGIRWAIGSRGVASSWLGPSRRGHSKPTREKQGGLGNGLEADWGLWKYLLSNKSRKLGLSYKLEKPQAPLPVPASCSSTGTQSAESNSSEIASLND